MILLAQGGGLETGPHSDQSPDDGRAGARDPVTEAAARADAPLRPWHQYASGEYVAIWRKHEMVPSMSRPETPYDNASFENFIKTLKREEIYTNQYQDLNYLLSNIEEFIQRITTNAVPFPSPIPV